MSNPSQTQGEQPATEAFPAVDGSQGGERPLESVPSSADISGLSTEQLISALEGSDGYGLEPDDAPASDPVDREDAASEPETEPGEFEAGGDAKKPPQRLSVRGLPPDVQTETARAIGMVRSGEYPDLLSAVQAIREEGQAQSPRVNGDGQETGRPVESGEAEQPAKSIEERLSELRAERKLAKTGFDMDREEEIQGQIEDLLAELAVQRSALAMEGERAAASKEQYSSMYQSAVDELERDYPESLDEGSVFSKMLDDKILAAQARNDPALRDPRFILGFAKELHAAIAGPAKTPASAPPPPKARQAAGASFAPGSSTPVRADHNQVRALIRSAGIEELRAVAYTE